MRLVVVTFNGRPRRTILLDRDELLDDTGDSAYLFLFLCLPGLSGFPVFALGLG